MDISEFRKLVVACKMDAIDAVEAHAPTPVRAKALSVFITDVKVHLTTRKSARAGCWSHHGGGSITVNVALCCDEEKFVSTLMHELAHAIVTWNGERHRGDSHGDAWKGWMRHIGLDPTNERTHSYDVNGAFPGFYTIATCAENHQIKMGPRKMAKVRRGASYICGRCHRNGVKNEVIIKREGA